MLRKKKLFFDKWADVKGLMMQNIFTLFQRELNFFMNFQRNGSK